MFSIPHVFGDSPAERNASRDTHIVEALGSAEESLVAALNAVRQVREQMEVPSDWGDSTALTMGTVVGRAEVIGGGAGAQVNRHSRDAHDALTKAATLAGGYEAASE